RPWVETARCRNALDNLGKLRFYDTLGSLAMRRCIVPFRNDVHAVRVFEAMIERGNEAELVERAAHERRFGDQARQADIARGLQVNGVKGRGEIVGPVASVEFSKRRGISY